MAQACLLCCAQCGRSFQRPPACCCSAPEEAPLEIVQLVDRCLDRNPALRPDALKVIQTISASLYRSAQAVTAMFCPGGCNMSVPHSAHQPGRPALALQAKQCGSARACVGTLLLPPWSCLASEGTPFHVWWPQAGRPAAGMLDAPEQVCCNSLRAAAAAPQDWVAWQVAAPCAHSASCFLLPFFASQQPAVCAVQGVPHGAPGRPAPAVRRAAAAGGP